MAKILKDNTDITRRVCFCYNPNHGNCIRILSLGKAILENSGVINSLCTSYLEAVGPHGFAFHVVGNPGNLAIDSSIFNDEITQRFKSGYIDAITAGASILDTLCSDVSSYYKQIKDKYDELPVRLAEKLDGVVFCADWWEAAYARFYNVPFVFLIQSGEQIKIFWEKMQRLCIYIYLISSKENGNI